MKIFDLSVKLIDRKFFDQRSYSLSNYKLLHMKNARNADCDVICIILLS